MTYFFIVLCLVYCTSNLLLRSTNGQDNCPSDSVRRTVADIEGPFYKRSAPFRGVDNGNIPAVCDSSVSGVRLFLNGTVRVITQDQPCGVPVRAFLDIWSANTDGVYSNTSPQSPDFTCRSVLLTDSNGMYALSTILPGHYFDNGWRPSHIHWKITPVNENNEILTNPLTTQLYFAEDQFLGPSDSCGICHSGDSSLITHITEIPDQNPQTMSGTWDIFVDGEIKNRKRKSLPKV